MQLKHLQGDLVFTLPVLGQSTAGTPDEWSGVKMPFAAKVVAAKWIPSAAITANGTNYATLTVRNRGAAGAGATLPASRSYIAGNSAAFVSEDMTLSADVNLAAGDVVTVEKLVTASGLAIPDGVVQLHVRAA